MLHVGLHEALTRPGPDLVICDEGHRIKNSHASISQALKNIRTKLVSFARIFFVCVCVLDSGSMVKEQCSLIALKLPFQSV